MERNVMTKKQVLFCMHYLKSYQKMFAIKYLNLYFDIRILSSPFVDM